MNKAEKQRRDRKLLPPKPWPRRPQKDQVLSSRNFQAGYRVDTVLIDNLPYMGKPMRDYAQRPGRFMTMRRAMTVKGDYYVGDPKWAHEIFVNRCFCEVQPQEAGQTCCVGYCPRTKRWFGWSHRAICGFGICDKLFDPNWRPRGKVRYTNEEIDRVAFVARGGRIIRNLKQAKQAALAFANYVS